LIGNIFVLVFFCECDLNHLSFVVGLHDKINKMSVIINNKANK
jgi:hypothetical protein